MGRGQGSCSTFSNAQAGAEAGGRWAPQHQGEGIGGGSLWKQQQTERGGWAPPRQKTMAHISSFAVRKPPQLRKHRQAPWRSKGRDANLCQASQIWTPNQASQNDWPGETWKKCPIESPKLSRGHDSLSAPACLSTCTIHFFLLISTCSPLSLWEFFFCKARGWGPCYWPSVWRLGCSALTAARPHLWLELLQAEATWGQPLATKSHLTQKVNNVAASYHEDHATTVRK